MTSCSIFEVRLIKSSTEICSGRKAKIASSLNLSDRLKDFKLFRNVFLLWLNAVFTTFLNNSSFTGKLYLVFRIMRMTPESTFGGGLKTDGGTVNKYSTS